jgi:hypothetical protein
MIGTSIMLIGRDHDLAACADRITLVDVIETLTTDRRTRWRNALVARPCAP